MLAASLSCQGVDGVEGLCSCLVTDFVIVLPVVAVVSVSCIASVYVERAAFENVTEIRFTVLLSTAPCSLIAWGQTLKNLVHFGG